MIHLIWNTDVSGDISNNQTLWPDWYFQGIAFTDTHFHRHSGALRYFVSFVEF